ncbi:unnamed protein product [Fusarium equiseti]|uniref:Gpi anchored serine-threonine rich protein n=1 Tax=Fusarium equiseti TaxID=61235 RepID=A0A8J2IXW6_FUSEQ|nr:unnamed protein product [Fusarium equiseti]
MKYLLFISFTISTFVNATPGFLTPRQDGCRPGYNVCGIECIPESYTCCHDPSGRSGGCPPGSRCGVGDNGVGGCCPVGKICTGNPTPASTIDESEFTPAADPTTAIDEPTATIDDGPPTKTTKPDTSKDNTSDDSSKAKPSGDTSESKGSDDDSAGASNRLDNTVSYLLVGAMVLLI